MVEGFKKGIIPWDIISRGTARTTRRSVGVGGGEGTGEETERHSLDVIIYDEQHDLWVILLTGCHITNDLLVPLLLL